MDILNAFVLLTNFLIIPGITYGCQLALGALGVTLIYGILRFSNFAHGETMAFGTMVTILFTWMLQSWGVSLGPLPVALLAMPVGIVACILLLLGTDKVVYKFYRRQKSTPVILLIASLGVMFFYNGLIRFIIGPDDRIFTDGSRFIITAREFKEMTGLEQGLAFKMTQGITMAVTILCVITLFWFLNKTRTGKSMRAYSDNEDLALLSGINPDRVVMIAWMLTAVLATIAGTLYGLDKSFKPFTYLQILLPIFAAAIVGGLGSPIGAIAGGFIIALSEVFVTFAYKRFLGYLLPEEWAPEGLVQLLSTDYKFAVSFAILVIVLLVRPTGIFRGQSI
ncbi:MAG: branched-chain amino acid ABC transporter permease [Pseudomonadota bacterium]